MGVTFAYFKRSIVGYLIIGFRRDLSVLCRGNGSFYYLIITWLLFIYSRGQWRAGRHGFLYKSTGVTIGISVPLMHHLPPSHREEKSNTWLHFHHVFNGSADARTTREILRPNAWVNDESAPRKGNIFALMSRCQHEIIVEWARRAIHRFIWQHHSLDYSGTQERWTLFLALNEHTHHKLH